MSVKTVSIRTAADGSYTWSRSFRGTIRAIEIQLGDLSTPDIAITDDTYSTNILTLTGISASAVHRPSAFLEAADGTTAALVGTGMKGATAISIMGVLKVAVTGGGDTKSGKVIILYDA
jgi:hypothetical protein